jgi:MFS family permease
MNINNLRNIFNEYPRQFWLLTLAVLLDAMGGWLIFPFLALYVTDKLDVSLSQVGLLYFFWALTGLVGNAVGGALADRSGRKRMVVNGLVLSAVTSLMIVLAPTYSWQLVAAAIGGFFSRVGQPAWHAMIADTLSEEQYADGFGIVRIADNLAAMIAPAIGGLLASVSYVLLFSLDILSSTIAAIFVARNLRETQPRTSAEKTTNQSMGSVFRGYLVALKDFKLIAVTMLTVLVGLAHFQLFFAFPVFLRDVHSFAPSVYGGLMSLAGGMVILFQFSLTRTLKHRSQVGQLAFGSLLFAAGFGFVGIIRTIPSFVLVMMLITFAGMIYFPVQQSLAALIAPDDMRGRYIAVAMQALSIPPLLGPGLAGLLIDRAAPNLLWFLVAMLCLVGSVGYLALGSRFGKKREATSSI